MSRFSLTALFGFLFTAVSLCQVSAYDKLSWDKKELLAGKADLTDGGYTISRIIGAANFSPEFRMPVQLSYNSLTKHKGLFGDFWTCPQLESRVFPRDKGAEWTTPWGEKLSFFAKEKITQDTLDYYKEKMQGSQGLFSPFSDWEAVGAKGTWRIEGKDKKEGWVFEYKDSYLQKITAPSGRVLLFTYNDKKLVSVSQDGTAFIELKYNNDKQLDSITVNGIRTSFNFDAIKGVSLPEKQGQSSSEVSLKMLSSIQYGTLEAETFAYDDYGYLSGIKRGEFSEKFVIEHETLAERNKWLDKLAEAEAKKVSKLTLLQEKVTGRILADKNFTYAYPAKETVTLTNAEKQTATYNYSGLKGVLKVKDFAGLSTEICYYRRYDVAFNGKLRQVRDAKDRVVLNNRYDKKTGELIRSRDMMENETYYTYDKERNLIKVSRSEGSEQRPLVAIKYDAKNNPIEYDTLNKNGESVYATKISYTASRDIDSVITDEGFIKFRYNNFGYPVSVSDTFNRDSNRNYDKFNRLVSQLTPEGVFIAYNYDANGLITAVEKYDSADKKELLSGVKFNYDKMGQTVSIEDNSGKIKKFDRDVEGRVTAEYFPDDTAVKYSFDKLGHLSKVIDQNGNPIEFSYNKFGKIEKRTNAENQLVGYTYDKFGLAESMNKKLVADKASTQEIKYSYNEFDRVTKINYGNGEEKSFKYDDRGKVLSIETSEKDKLTFVTKLSYDEFDRVEKKIISRVKTDGRNESSIYTYSYTNSGKLLTEKISFPDGTSRNIKRSYDKFGRLTEIKDTDKSVKYAYDKKSRLAVQTIDNIPVHYTYTKYGQLESKVMGDDIKNPIGSLKYFYEKDGSLIGRVVNGSVQNFTYDKKGQLLKVTDLSGKVLESYTYDNAGNILEKNINGKTTTFAYDKANQLVTATDADGKNTSYKYDAAGRLSQEASADVTKNYSYGWLDKVTKVDNGTAQSVFNYFPDGQLAEKVVGSDTERFYWDGLALIKRDSREFTNEPAVTGGNPVIANNKVMLNDMLGNSIGAYDKEYQAIDRTAFGETSTKSDIDFFTGKPNVEGLGYNFLFRNYNANLGKWQTSDPLGYPDGWNNLAYCNNKTMSYIDQLGTEVYNVVASKAVGGAGHSAGIYGYSNGDSKGYKIVDFGGDSPSNVSDKTFSSFNEALSYLQKTREGSGEPYDKVQKWDLNDSQTVAAFQKTLTDIEQGYSPANNNCYQVIADGINSAGGYAYMGLTPNGSFDVNNDPVGYLGFPTGDPNVDALRMVELQRALSSVKSKPE